MLMRGGVGWEESSEALRGWGRALHGAGQPRPDFFLLIFWNFSTCFWPRVSCVVGPQPLSEGFYRKVQDEHAQRAILLISAGLCLQSPLP